VNNRRAESVAAVRRSPRRHRGRWLPTSAALEQDPFHRPARRGHHCLPTAELPVKLTMSIRGSVVSTLAGLESARGDDVDDARRNVGVLIDDPGKRQAGKRVSAATV
jgi:hypothetical protein